MADLTEVREELLGVLLKEELCDLGVLQAPCPAGGGHAGSPMQPRSPGTIWACECDCDYAASAPADDSSARGRQYLHGHL